MVRRSRCPTDQCVPNGSEAHEGLRAGHEELGGEFLPADDEAGVGYGVRRKFNPRTVKRIENWENEGGPALEDDI